MWPQHLPPSQRLCMQNNSRTQVLHSTRHCVAWRSVAAYKSSTHRSFRRIYAVWCDQSNDRPIARSMALSLPLYGLWQLCIAPRAADNNWTVPYRRGNKLFIAHIWIYVGAWSRCCLKFLKSHLLSKFYRFWSRTSATLLQRLRCAWAVGRNCIVIFRA